MSNKKWLGLLIAAALSQSAAAAPIFQVTATTSTTVTLGFTSAQDAIDVIGPNKLGQYVPYTGVEAATIGLNFRGLPMTVAHPNGAGDPLLTLSIPSLGIAQNFTGATRADSQRLLSDFFKSGDVLSQIMRRLAEVSPVDPIAGNPNSLMSQMVANDFNNSFFGVGSNLAPPQASTNDSTPNLIGIGLRFGQYRQGSLTSQNLTLPLSYTIRSNIDPRRQLILSLPISQTDAEGSKAYYVGAGAAYRFPMNDNWTLTPSFSYAVTGAPDFGSVSQIAAASLSSTYVIPMKSYDLAIGNMVGFYKTLKFSANGYSFDPNISNTVFRNGVMLSTPISFMGRKMSIEYSLIDTRFTGTALYNEGYDEIGITIGTNKNAQSARSYLRGGISYLFSPQSKGFTVNIGYWF